MKQFIIMSLTLLAFSLISCGKKEEEDDEKDDKAKPSVEVPTTKADCDAKEGYTWDATANNNAGVCEPSSKETCEANQRVWDATANSNAGVCNPKAEATTPEATTATSYNITNKTSSTIVVTSGEALTADVSPNKCVTVQVSEWANLKVQFKVTSGGTGTLLCDNTDMLADDRDTTDVDESNTKNTGNDCGQFHAEVSSGSNGRNAYKASTVAGNDQGCVSLTAPAAPAAP